MGVLSRKVAQVYAGRKSRVVRVPEWDIDIHVFPLTLGQLSRINEETDPIKRLVRVLLVRAKKEDGEPLFDIEDAEALISQGVAAFGPDVVMRVCAELGEVEFPDEAQAEKN
jgi:hypothetical protein